VEATSPKIKVKMILDAGAKEVHFRIASPPSQMAVCFYGVGARAARKSLLARNHVEEEMREHFNVDSPKFQLADGLVSPPGEAEGRNNKCPPPPKKMLKMAIACFLGHYRCHPY